MSSALHRVRAQARAQRDGARRKMSGSSGRCTGNDVGHPFGSSRHTWRAAGKAPFQPLESSRVRPRSSTGGETNPVDEVTVAGFPEAGAQGLDGVRDGLLKIAQIAFLMNRCVEGRTVKHSRI